MIKYRKAKEFLDQLVEDLPAYDEAGNIDYSKLYKIIRRCNATLGERINPEKQELVRVQNYRGRVPVDFYSLNYALIAENKKVNTTYPSGFNVEYKTVSKCVNGNCSPCLAECENNFVIVQKCNEEVFEFQQIKQVKVTTKSFKHCQTGCPNMQVRLGHSIDIGDDGWVTADFKEGYVYFNYVGNMEDDDEDLLVIDHPLIEPYYEAALTNQILKTVLYNKEGDVGELYKDSKIELSRAKIQAISLVSMPGYRELQELYQTQRIRLYNKFFRPIDGA